MPIRWGEDRIVTLEKICSDVWKSECFEPSQWRLLTYTNKVCDGFPFHHILLTSACQSIRRGESIGGFICSTS